MLNIIKVKAKSHLSQADQLWWFWWAGQGVLDGLNHFGKAGEPNKSTSQRFSEERMALVFRGDKPFLV